MALCDPNPYNWQTGYVYTDNKTSVPIKVGEGFEFSWKYEMGEFKQKAELWVIRACLACGMSYKMPHDVPDSLVCPWCENLIELLHEMMYGKSER